MILEEVLVKIGNHRAAEAGYSHRIGCIGTVKSVGENTYFVSFLNGACCAYKEDCLPISSNQEVLFLLKK